MYKVYAHDDILVYHVSLLMSFLPVYKNRKYWLINNIKQIDSLLIAPESSATEVIL